MPPWEHPKLGPVELLPPKLQPKKVWKHFYDPAEHWERLTTYNPAEMRGDAERIVGVSRDDQAELPQLETRLCGRMRSLLQHHHELAYGPTYLAEMASTEAEWTLRMDARHRHHAATPRGVFVVVQLGEPSSVLTAYRPHPPTRGIDWQEEAFVRQARRLFKREANMNLERMAHVAAENLARVASTRPTSVNDLWWLASAVGYGRALKDSIDVRAALPAAEASLSAVAPSLVTELVDALDWEGTLDRIAGGLVDDRSEELESALEAAEELLVVGEALGAEERQRFLERIEDLLPWLPARWTHLVELATAQSRLLGGDLHIAGQLWESVADQTMGALVRTSIPVVMKAPATLANELLAQAPRWRRWQARVAGLPMRASASVRAWVDASLSGVRVLAPAPAMGGGAQAQAWEVCGLPAADNVPARVFVVDSQNPDGYEVTGHFVLTDGYLWRIDNEGDAALVILVAGDSAVTGNTLEEVLASVSSRSDTYAQVRLLTPPR